MKKLIPMINETARHANGFVTRKCDAALADGVLVKVGSDADHVAVATAATEKPLGIAFGATDAAEDVIGIELFTSQGTKKATAVAAIDVDDLLCAAAGGKIQKVPVAAGTYYIIGRALTAAGAAGVVVEFEGCLPIKTVVEA